MKDSSFLTPDTQETVSEDLNLTHEDITIASEQTHTESSPPTLKNMSKRKGIFHAIGELKKLQKVINQSVSELTQKEDRFDIFGKSVAMQLRALSFERGMIGQARIQNILTELSIDNYKSNKSFSTETTSERTSRGFYPSFSGAERTNIAETLTSPELSTLGFYINNSEANGDNIL